MRGSSPWLLGLLGVACSPGGVSDFIQLPELPSTARSLVLLVQASDEDPVASIFNLTDPRPIEFELDTFEDVKLYGMVYPCPLEALELVPGHFALSGAGRPMPRSAAVLESAYSGGAQTPWEAAVLPATLDALRLPLPNLDLSSPLAPCLFAPSDRSAVLVPESTGEVGDGPRWISLVGGDEVVVMRGGGELLRGTHDGLESIAQTKSWPSDGALANEETWWVVDRRGQVFSGDFAGQVVPRGWTRTASVSGRSDRHDVIAVAPDSSEVYVFTDERVLERCLPGSNPSGCEWQVLGASERHSEDHLRMIWLGPGHVLAVGGEGSVLEFRGGRLSVDRVFSIDSGYAIGQGVPELGTVMVGVAGTVVYRPQTADVDWVTDDPRFSAPTDTIQSRFVIPTRRGFLHGGTQGLVQEYDLDGGLCPAVRAAETSSDLFQGVRSASGFWFISRRGSSQIFFVPEKAPSCLETQSL